MTAITLEGEPARARWNNLPHLTLTNIFGYLDRRDRVAASEVCPRWGEAFSSPSGWRTITVNLDRDLLTPPDPSLSLEEPLAVHLARLFGHYMRRLELVWCRPYGAPPIQGAQQPPRGAFSLAAINFILMLTNNKVQLEEIVLKDWIFTYKWGHRNRLIQTLSAFMGTQHNLVSLSLRNACMGSYETIRLITAATRSSRDFSFKRLDICGAFREWKAPFTNPRYLEMLGRLRGLTTLHVDYSAVSDEMLETISETTNGSLQCLLVEIHGSDNHQHTISDRIWLQLTTACPKLRVELSLGDITHFDDLRYFLMPSIPLRVFRLIGGSVWDQTRSRNLRKTILWLLTYYTATLEYVQLQVKNNREILDDLILRLLTQCRIQYFQYDGTLGNMNTIREMCAMQVKRGKQYGALHVRPRYMNNGNWLIMKDIYKSFSHQMAEQNIDFSVDDSPSLFMFT